MTRRATVVAQEPSGARSSEAFLVEAIPYNGALSKGDAVGYFNHRRIKVGEQFRVTAAQFSSKWMQRVGEKNAKLAKEESDDLDADEARSGGRKPAESVI